jgi:hypothetical protein
VICGDRTIITLALLASIGCQSKPNHDPVDATTEVRRRTD